MNLVGRRYDTGLAVEIALDPAKSDRIESAAPLPDAQQADASLPWIAPGFLDLQVNGFAGCSFTDAAVTVDAVVETLRTFDRTGVTQLLPTITTQSADVLSHSLATVHRACEQSPAAARRVAGIHLEGPYLSPEDGPRGAHPKAHVRSPDWDEFRRLQDAAGGRICLVTLSAEYPQSPQFIERLVAAGVTVSIGHTSADTQAIAAAVDAGARMSTHLGNGAHPRIRRHPNYIWDQLADDRLTAGLIVDGHHLPPAVVKSFVRVKTPDRCVLVSDVTSMAGMPPGSYQDTSLGAVDVLPDGRLVVGGQTEILAGASLPIGVGIANVMRMAGVDLRTAVDMATRNPARLAPCRLGGLEVGDVADLVVFELKPSGEGPPQLNVLATINGGEAVYRTRTG